jgi:hypothetical protein
MEDTIIIARSYETCKNDLVSFRNANRELERGLDYLDWRYTRRPCEVKPLILWAETVSGDRIGVLSMIPNDFSVDNKPCRLGILGDVSVGVEWRGKGVLTRMLKHLSKKGEVDGLGGCLVLPNEDAAGGFRRAEWKTVLRVERYVKIIDFEKRIGSRPYWRNLPKEAFKCLNNLAKMVTFENILKETSEFKVEQLTDFDERFDELWDRINKKRTIIGCRNKDYLRWRYVAHPVTRYCIFSLTRNQEELCGYVVCHFSEEVCYIDDMLSLDDQKCKKYLLFYFLKLIQKDTHISAIVLRANRNSVFNFPLRQFGFVKRPDYQRLMVWRSQYGELNSLDKGNRWFITAGDKDV